MGENLKNKYKLITLEKETIDTKKLVEIIKLSGWVKSDMIIVNCFPEYSSRLCQSLNHALSTLNKHELFEIVNLPMSYPNMAQVWDSDEKVYKGYIRYLTDWVRKYVTSYDNYLFTSLDSSTSNLTRVKAMVRGKMENEQYRFATLYKEKNNLLTPDFYVEEYDETHRELAFHWENLDNPNWK